MKKGKPAKMRLAIFGTLSVFAIITFILTLSNSVIKIKNLKDDEIFLTNRLSTLKKDAEILKTDIEKLKDPNYQAKYAREKFYYSTNGEIIIRFEKDKEEITEETANYSNPYKYIIITIGVILLIIIIYVLRKR